MTKQLISIIIPIFNEELTLQQLYQELHTICQKITSYDVEIIMIDDGSTDTSWDMLTALAQQDKRIKILRFTRNFGYQAALTAGYNYASGNCVISLDGDLQHPPELIIPMLKQWQKGHLIVYARRKKQHDTFFKIFSSKFFQQMLNYLSTTKIPDNVSDFRLIDRIVVQEINRYPEKCRFLRSLVAWTGFQAAYIDFDQPKRHHGTTKYSLKKLFIIASNGIISSSLFPLKIAAFIGLFVMLSGFGMLGIITIDALFFQGHYPLFKWLVTIIYIFLGFLFMLVWILGEYIGRIYEELKNRPLYIVQEMVGIQKKDLYESNGMSPHKFTQRISRSAQNRHSSHRIS